MNKPLLNLCRLHLYQTLTLLYGTWKKIALTADDRLAVGAHLCNQEFEVLRGFLVSMGQDYFERWVYKYLSGGDDPDN